MGWLRTLWFATWGLAKHLLSKQGLSALAVGVWAFCLAPLAAVAGPALVFEPENGAVIYSEDPDRKWHPASLTKMMTAFVVFEALKAGELKIDDTIIMSETARKAPWGIGWPVGHAVPVRLALEALMVRSANDTAVMLGEKVSGSEAAFVQRMNRTARALGMTRTNFVNAHGLHEPLQYTSARDLARLTVALLKRHPTYTSIYSQQFVRIGRLRVRARNRKFLRQFEGADGIKTGFVCASGYNVVASATRDGRKLVAVMLGETTFQGRVRRASELLHYAFDNYDWKRSLFPMNLASLPQQGADIPLQNIRKTVRQGACGYRSDPRLWVRRRRGGSAFANGA